MRAPAEHPDPDVLLAPARAEETREQRGRLMGFVGAALSRRTSRRGAYAQGAGVVAVATALCALLFGHLELANLVMVYLLGTVLVAARFGRGPSVFAAILSVGLFDFLFVPPYYSFAVSDAQYLVTFAVMLVTALVISNLAALGKRQAAVARQRERRARELYGLSRELAESGDVGELGAILCRHVLAGVDGAAAVLLPDESGLLLDPTHFCARGAATRFPVPGNDLGIAQWAYDHREKAGRGTQTLASADAVYLPLNALHRCIGVLALRPRDIQLLEIPEQMHLLESFVSQAAVAMERVQLAAAAQRADSEIAAEKVRNVLLSSISHDFRTPLASIVGMASTLLDTAAANLSEERRRELLGALVAEAQRLHRLVGNLLDLTRLTSGPVRLNSEWVALEELVGAVLERLRSALGGRDVRVDIAADFPLVHSDESLIEQVLFNLVENAQKHTPAGTPIRIAAKAFPALIEVSVADTGSGLPAGDEQRIFEKFHRGRAESAQSGFGLGLRSARRSSKRTAARSARATCPRAGRSSASACRAIPRSSRRRDATARERAGDRR